MKKRIVLLFIIFLSLLVLASAHAAEDQTDSSLRWLLNHPEQLQTLQEQTDTTSSTLAAHNVSKPTDLGTAFLPSSLKEIGDQAFEGTQLKSVEVPSSVTSIGEGAFSNIPSLTSIKLPDSVEHIGKDAFAGSNHVTIAGSTNSYARNWAVGHGIAFTPVATITANHNSQLGTNLSVKQKDRNDETAYFTAPVNTKVRRTGRNTGELKLPQNKGSASIYIQSRYFP